MADDAKATALSIMQMYGDGAESVARKYAEKHRRSGDLENHATWLQVADYIAKHSKNVRP